MRLDSNLTTALHKSFTYLLTYLLINLNAPHYIKIGPCAPTSLPLAAKIL